MENNADKDKRCVARTWLDYIKIRPEYSSGGCCSYDNVDHKRNDCNQHQKIGNKKRKNQTSYFLSKM